MSSARNRKKGDETAADKAKNCARVALGGAQAAGSAVFSMSVHSYFLWSSICFLTCALTLTVGGPQVKAFMCDKPPQAIYGGPGCDNCSSELLACHKNLCYRNTVNLTWLTQAKHADQVLYQPYSEAVTDVVCTDLFRSKAANPIEMIVSISEQTDPAVTTGCVEYHCGLLRNALGGGSLTDLSSPTGKCTNTFGHQPGGDDTSCPCGSLIRSPQLSQAAPTILNLCGVWLNNLCPYGDFTGSWCPPPQAAPTTAAAPGAASPTTAAGGANIRRLEPPHYSWKGRALGNATISRQFQNGRRLQAPAPPPAPNLNDALPEFTVGAWSKCTCYQQCTPGLKTRSVKCMAEQCKKPAPKSADECACDHCAKCLVDMPVWILSLIYFGQCAVAVICFLCYLHAATAAEEAFIKISYMELLGGLASKNFPPLVRLAVLVTCGFTFWILIETWIPKLFDLDWMTDCYDSQVLRTISIICSSVWVFQVLLGRCAKRVARKPPWLFSPARASLPPPLKQISEFFRGLGP